MSDTAAPESKPAELTDAAILERFLRTKNQPTGSQTLGFRMVAVNQAEKSVEVEFDAKAELLLNPMKQIQGGYLCAMLDECMSVACMVASGMTAVAPTPAKTSSPSPLSSPWRTVPPRQPVPATSAGGRGFSGMRKSLSQWRTPLMSRLSSGLPGTIAGPEAPPEGPDQGTAP